ncbi:hypothetical protein PHISP_05822 [Aspergillus sp. HF37]|nr:hypothetical protein PHISP_05822 [Aspergillus sp. HF37]
MQINPADLVGIGPWRMLHASPGRGRRENIVDAEVGVDLLGTLTGWLYDAILDLGPGRGELIIHGRIQASGGV